MQFNRNDIAFGSRAQSPELHGGGGVGARGGPLSGGTRSAVAGSASPLRGRAVRPPARYCAPSTASSHNKECLKVHWPRRRSPVGHICNSFHVKPVTQFSSARRTVHILLKTF